MNPQSLPIRPLYATGLPPTLSQAVAEARYPRNPATAQLSSHREELLKLRREGASVESLVGGLRRLGVEIGCETLRVWLNRELGKKPRRLRQRSRIETKPKIELSPAPRPATHANEKIPETGGLVLPGPES